METECKWATTGILLVVFVGLVSVAGCIHIAEYLGAIFVGILVARWFFLSVCKNNLDHFADRK